MPSTDDCRVEIVEVSDGDGMLEGYVGVDGSGGGDGVPRSSVAETECGGELSGNWTPLEQKYDGSAFRS